MKLSYSTVELIVSLLGIYLVSNGKGAETKNILYYGWFFDEVTAESLQKMTASYFNEYLEDSPQFKTFIESAIKNANLSSPQEYFKKPLDPNSKEFDPLYHTTAKFCGGKNNCSPYSDLEVVSKNTGKIFTMELIGWFFTNRTYGIRVQLSDEQQELYKKGGEPAISKNVQTTMTNKDYPGLAFEGQELNLTPSTSKAHITIGCAPGISAEITGDDLERIVQLESDTDVRRVNISIPDAYLMIQYNGEWEAFVVYPTSKIKANATFRPYYSNSKGNKNVNSFLISFSFPVILYHLCYALAN